MTFPVFASGDVLNASDMNAVGLWLLVDGTFTTVTSFAPANNTFTSDYENYRIMVNISALTSDADFTLRLRASGTDDANANYNSMFMGIDSGGTARNRTGGSATSFNVGEADATFANRYQLVLDICKPRLTARTEIVGGYVFIDKAATYNAATSGGGFYNADTQFDSFSFISSVASSITGTYQVYGYRS